MFFLAALALWLCLLALAMLCGVLREKVVKPRLGDGPARALCTLLLCALIFGCLAAFVAALEVRGAGRLLYLGAFLTALTLAFECGFGRLRGLSWEEILADYNLLRGRLWPLVLATTLLGPFFARLLMG